MSDWTDDELGALLADTFHSREELADPIAAIRIADRVADRRRRWPVVVAAAASVAILVTGTAYIVVKSNRGTEGGPSSNPPTAVPTPGLTDADNLAAAAKESERVLGLAPLPPGADRISGEPEGWPDGGFGMSPSNEALTRTAWYAVPISADAVQEFLVAHVPDGMTADVGVGNSMGIQTYDYTTRVSREPAAYTGPTLLVQWYDTGETTAIRFDAVLAIRRARTPETYLTGTVTSVDIGGTVENHAGRGSTRTLPTIRLSADNNPDALDRLVASLNALHGAVVSTTVHSCPPQIETTTYRFAFQTEHGDVSYQWINGCDPEIEVTRGGKRISPSLDPGDVKDTVTEILAESGLAEDATG